MYLLKETQEILVSGGVELLYTRDEINLFR
jgi:hypothetical protein